MPGKANTYTLGEFGVNRVGSPVHLVDGELLAAVNADVPFQTGNRGLRKRSGMAKLNTDAAAGAILSLTWIPLPDPEEDALSGPGSASGFEIFVDGANSTRRTVNGTTFTNKNIAAKGSAWSAGSPPKSYYYNGTLYYMADTLGQIRAYNGTTDVLEAALPALHPTTGTALSAVNGFCGLGNKLFAFAAYDSPYFQVMVTTIGTGTVATFCEGLKNTAGVETGFLLRAHGIGIVAWGGEVWIGAYDTTGTTGYVYRAGAGNTAWAADRTMASRFLSTVGQAGASLWMVSEAAAGSNYQVERRDVSGSTTVVRGPQAAQPCIIAAYGERAYLAESTNLLRTTDNGTAFTTIATGTIASSVGSPGKLTTLNGTYYVLLNTELIRDDGASVTEINVGGGAFLSGFVRI